MLSAFSPKFRHFVVIHPQASQLLTNVISEAFEKRTLQLYYFYSDDESIPRAYHYYPSDSVVGVAIRENQQAVDEFICFIFEALNSEGEKSFEALCQKAKSGEISRTDFALEISRIEFKAVLRTRDLLSSLKLTRGEVSESYNYKRYLDCPSKFDDFLVYTKKVSSPERDSIKEYEAQYDSLRKP